MIFVCSYGCVGPLITGLYKLNGGSGRRHAGPHTSAGPTTHPLTDPQMEKNYVFRNPRDAISNFCYGLIKLPNHFNKIIIIYYQLFKSWSPVKYLKQNAQALLDQYA